MRTIEKFFKKILIQLLLFFRSAKKYPPQEISFQTIRRILIIRQHDQLGDLLITTPAIRAVRKKYPKAFIAVVVREYTAPVMIGNPNTDDVIIFFEKLKRWNWQKLVSFWKSLRSANGFDAAIVLNTISRSLSSDVIALLSKARFIVGPDHLQLHSELPEKIYNILTPRSKKYQTEIQHNLDIVSAIGCEPDGVEYDLGITNEERIEAENIFISMEIMKGGKAVGVHFGTLDKTRKFPLEKLAQIIDWMNEKYTVEIILIVGPNEIHKREYLLSLLHTKVISAPLMPLRVTAAFMRHLDLFICNDTGTLHIASAMRTPTVSFHGPNDPEIWKPPHPRHIPVRAADKKITSITVEMAKEAIDKQLHSDKKR